MTRTLPRKRLRSQAVRRSAGPEETEMLAHHLEEEEFVQPRANGFAAKHESAPRQE
ncbi:hypothetical protein MAXJ12_35756 [Mesorhizobium alhagi CCNWXJ12-2]|uniref:Uncharacterized protein n=1 Tax=Mesorhizobium alhagi CCNWXJ12-2 TaxID=1107882 RepID=H0I3T4_9HYPH|nr:hypothetical protein MAXJ12_35756 [Mesorhizobium alhagi CCNWXJ12-2]